MSAHISTCSSEAVRNRHQVCHGVGDQDIFRLAAIHRVADSPATDRLAAAVRMIADQASMTCPSGVSCACDDALPYAEFFRRADRLVAYRKAAGHWILAFQDMGIGATDMGRCHAQRGIQMTDLRKGLSCSTIQTGSANTAASYMAPITQTDRTVFPAEFIA